MIKGLSFLNQKWRKYTSLVSSINQLEAELQNLSQSRLQDKTKKLKKTSFSSSTDLDTQVLVESFALVREAARRTVGLRHYDNQLVGGFVLNENKIAEMRTGEGKTLVATAPAFANALSGKGVHLVTVNEYLANRDAEWMGQVYRYLGLHVGLIRSEMEVAEKKKNYHRDITYVTSNELGFDFLKDNLVLDRNKVVQRPFHYCIVDEVDSILIDEARTPLIISGSTTTNLDPVVRADEVAKYLKEGKDFEIEPKSKSISLTSRGSKKAEKILKVSSLYNQDEPWIPFLLNALKAQNVFLKNVQYLVKDQSIVIVDEFTGRVMEGRTWAEGLHTAIEVKEKIYKAEGSETIASISYQNFFRLYPKMGGMTGTAKTAELEFENIYRLSVSVLPTFKPIQRVDLPDAIYMDEMSKWTAVADECKRFHRQQRPILVGTTNIQNSERLSALLKEAKIPHQLLNAKPENIQRESDIIAQAGCLGSVTIATNMAGRGTDILLGGNPSFEASRQCILVFQKLLAQSGIDSVEGFFDRQILAYFFQELQAYSFLLKSLLQDFESLLNLVRMPNQALNSFEALILSFYTVVFEYYDSECKHQKQKILSLGGLYVIGTERHDSRRIDNQLRGRAGRQGDVGSSRFFLSLSDPLLKSFGGERIQKMMKAFQLDKEALELSFLSSALDNAQQKVEGFYYDQRKDLHKYDLVLDKQRSLIYFVRKKILFSVNLRNLFLELGEAVVTDFLRSIHRQPRPPQPPAFATGLRKLFQRVKIRKLFQRVKTSVGKNQNSRLKTDSWPSRRAEKEGQEGPSQNKRPSSKTMMAILEDLNFSFEGKTTTLVSTEEETKLLSEKEEKAHFLEEFWSLFCLKEASFQAFLEEGSEEYQRFLLLENLDLAWSEHLENMSFLQDAVRWEGYAQRDPFLTYQEKAKFLFAQNFQKWRDTVFFEVLSLTNDQDT